MVYTQLNFHCLFSSAQSRLAKSFFFKKHKLCQKRIYSASCSMQRKSTFITVSAAKFSIPLKNMLPSFKANFRWSIKQRSNFEKIIKYLSTFYIRFKRTVSNQRNVHRRFLTTTWTEDRSALKRLNAKDIAKKLWYSKDILIDHWLYECFSVISSLPDNGGPHLHFTQLLYILVHFYALASHCTYILSCWKIEAYNVLVKFTFALAGMEVLQTII